MTRISFLPTVSLVLTFILILAFEIYASATIFGQILFKSPSTQTTVYLAGFISTITLIYALWGGVVAVLKTDRIQIIGVLAVVLLLAYAALIAGDGNKPGVRVDSVSSSDVYWGVAAAVCGAIATQFYSLLNWGTVSNFTEGRDSSWTLRSAGILTFVLLSTLVLIGLYAGTGEAGASFKNIIDKPFLTTSSIWTYVLVAGMVCIVFSTADSLVIHITMFFYDNILGKNSNESTSSLVDLRNLRLLALFVFWLALLAVMIFIVTQQDLLYLLFAVAGGIIVYAPLMFLVLVLSKNPSSLIILSGLTTQLFFALFLLAFGANVAALIYDPSSTAKVVTISFVLSCIAAVTVFIRAGKEVRQ